MMLMGMLGIEICSARFSERYLHIVLIHDFLPEWGA
jgi:hypothetical protein